MFVIMIDKLPYSVLTKKFIYIIISYLFILFLLPYISYSFPNYDYDIIILDENTHNCINSEKTFGKNTSFQIILIFNNIPENVYINPLDLNAIIGPNIINIPFKKKNCNEYMTNIIHVNDLQKNISDNLKIFIEYKNHYLNGKTKKIKLDTKSPKRPYNVKIIKNKNNFLLVWEQDENNLVYSIKRKEKRKWITLKCNLYERKINLGDIYYGEFQIISYDCAQNATKITKSFFKPLKPEVPTKFIIRNKTIDSFEIFLTRSNSSNIFFNSVQKQVEAEWFTVTKDVKGSHLNVNSSPEGIFRLVAKNWIGEEGISSTFKLKIPSVKFNIIKDYKYLFKNKMITKINDNKVPVKICNNYEDADYTININVRTNKLLFSENDVFVRYRAVGEITLNKINCNEIPATVKVIDNSDFYGNDKTNAFDGKEKYSYLKKVVLPMIEKFIDKFQIYLDKN